MSVSRTSQVLLVAAICALIVPHSGLAQDDEATGPPVNLFEEEREEAPEEAGRVEVEPTPDPVAIDQPGESGEDGIEVSTLRAVDPGSIGLLDEGAGGFGLDMWDGTERRVISNLLPRLPMGTTSRFMQELARRLLLSEARVPPGDEESANLLELRIERLAAGGETEAVNRLMRLAPPGAVQPRFARIEVDGLYLVGDYAGACARATTLVRESDDPYWLKAVAFCHALHGEEAKAMLAVDLLYELGYTGDQPFNTLVSALSGHSADPLASLVEPKALHLAMMRAAKMAIPADALGAAPPAILRTIASAPNASTDLRLAAATRAEAVGVLGAESLSQIYASLTFDPDELDDVEAMIAEDAGPRGQALLYQLGQIETAPQDRAHALERGLQFGREHGQYATAARVNLLTALTLSPAPDVSWLGPELARGLLMAGATERAAAWYDLLAVSDLRAADALRPLIHIADPEAVPWEAEHVARWWRSQEGIGEAERLVKAGILLTVLEALGNETAETDWAPLLYAVGGDLGRMPPPGIWHGLVVAAADGRTGETVLLALIALGDEGPATVHPVALAAIIGALGRVGFGAEARALTIEAAVARGL